MKQLDKKLIAFLVEERNSKDIVDINSLDTVMKIAKKAMRYLQRSKTYEALKGIPEFEVQNKRIQGEISSFVHAITQAVFSESVSLEHLKNLLGKFVDFHNQFQRLVLEHKRFKPEGERLGTSIFECQVEDIIKFMNWPLFKYIERATPGHPYLDEDTEHYLIDVFLNPDPATVTATKVDPHTFYKLDDTSKDYSIPVCDLHRLDLNNYLTYDMLFKVVSYIENNSPYRLHREGNINNNITWVLYRKSTMLGSTSSGDKNCINSLISQVSNAIKTLEREQNATNN